MQKQPIFIRNYVFSAAFSPCHYGLCKGAVTNRFAEVVRCGIIIECVIINNFFNAEITLTV